MIATATEQKFTRLLASGFDVIVDGLPCVCSRLLTEKKTRPSVPLFPRMLCRSLPKNAPLRKDANDPHGIPHRLCRHCRR